MKNIWKQKSLWFAGIGCGAVLLNGCGGAKNETPEQSAKTPDAKTAQQPAPVDDAAAKHDHAAADAHKHEVNSGVPFAHHTKMRFSSAPSTPVAGQSATWTLKISNAKTGAPIPKFEVMHEKQLHLIVASKDFSWYSHIHPQRKGNGVFTMKYALPRAGEYLLYADYVTPEGGHEVAQHELKIGGKNPLPMQSKLVADQLKGPWLVKKFRAHDESFAPKNDAPQYEVALMPMPGVLRAGEEAMLHFQVRDAKGKPLTDLQPYMGAMGHAVILSQDGKSYLHSHPLEGDMGEMMMDEEDHAGHDHSKMDHSKMDHGAKSKGGGPDVMFHTGFPKAGLYKAWGQFKHKNKIITSSFVLKVLPGMTQKP